MELHIDMYERMKHYQVPGVGVALIQNGQIRMAEGFGVMEAETDHKVTIHSIFNACSISKFLTSMLVLKLTELGMLALDEDVNEKLTSWKIPDNECTHRKNVTLRTLLSHQSGVIDPNDSFGPLFPQHRMPAMIEIAEGTTAYCKEPLHVKYEPESDFQYADAGFCIIQLLIEDVCGKSFEDVMNELVFEPLQMSNSAYRRGMETARTESYCCGHDKNGHPVDGVGTIYPYPAAAGLWTTPSDLALLIMEITNCLKDNSQLGISASTIKEMIAPTGCRKWAGLEISSLGWGIGFQCMLVAYPYAAAGAVIMTNIDMGVHQQKGIIGDLYRSLSCRMK